MKKSQILDRDKTVIFRVPLSSPIYYTPAQLTEISTPLLSGVRKVIWVHNNFVYTEVLIYVKVGLVDNNSIVLFQKRGLSRAAVIQFRTPGGAV